MKRTNLVKKLALTLAATATIGATTTLAGCTPDLYNDVIANLGADSNTAINNIIFIAPETTTEGNYISFIAHYDTGLNGGYYTAARYENHKDYRITYQVSKEDYTLILKMCNEGALVRYAELINKDKLKIINYLISTYDPIEVKEFAVKDDTIEHYYTEDYEYKG